MSEAEWRTLCERYDKDPSLDYFEVPVDSLSPGGVSQAPPEPLTRLIAVYVLSGLPIDLLLRTLHHDPEMVDDEQLEMHIEGKKTKNGEVAGLRSKAKTVARLVRGSQLRTGPSTGELTTIEEDAAAYITLRRQEGAADEAILRELREGYGLRKRERFGVVYEAHTWRDMTMNDLRRLGKLRLGPATRPRIDA